MIHTSKRFWLTEEQWTDIMYSVVGISPCQSRDPDDMTEYPIPDGAEILKFVRDNQKCGINPKEQQFPKPTDEQCRICEQATRKDEREQWKKGILKFTEEDPLLMAYSDGYKTGKKDKGGHQG